MSRNSKQNQIILLLVIIIIVFTACGATSNEEVANSNAPTDYKGKFVELDITPEGIENAQEVTFSQGDNSNYLLNVFDLNSQDNQVFLL